METDPARRGAWRRILLLLLVLLVVPLVVSACVFGREGGVPWYEARRDASGLAPDPAATQEAVIQVYAARAVAWRGIFAVHTWIAVKPAGAPRYTRYEVVGFGVGQGAPAVRVDRMGPDNYWFGARPELVLDRRGPEAEALIGKIRAAVEKLSLSARIPRLAGTQQQHLHRLCRPRGAGTGPRSALQRRRQGLSAGRRGVRAGAPSGTGYQVSLFGLAGLLAARDEGIELNLLGFAFGVDFKNPA